MRARYVHIGHSVQLCRKVIEGKLLYRRMFWPAKKAIDARFQGMEKDPIQKIFQDQRDHGRQGGCPTSTLDYLTTLEYLQVF